MALDDDAIKKLSEKLGHKRYGDEQDHLRPGMFPDWKPQPLPDQDEAESRDMAAWYGDEKKEIKRDDIKDEEVKEPNG